MFVGVYGVLMGVTGWLLLSESNVVGCLLQTNCKKFFVEETPGEGAEWDLEGNEMPSGFRYLLFGYCVVNCVVVVLFEKVCVLGWVGDLFRGKRRDGLVV